MQTFWFYLTRICYLTLAKEDSCRIMWGGWFWKEMLNIWDFSYCELDIFMSKNQPMPGSNYIQSNQVGVDRSKIKLSKLRKESGLLLSLYLDLFGLTKFGFH